jgi:hypothetical protein
MLHSITAALLAVFGALPIPPQRPAPSGVEVFVNNQAKRVDVSIDGHPFTSYVWPDSLTKPVLFPVRTAAGTAVTRGFPLEPRPGERVDHPHQTGLWFTYGDVNGVDFWNNSTALTPSQQAAMGTIVHRRVVRASGGKDKGELEVETEWRLPGNKTVLAERTTFVFRGGRNQRTIDRITRLTALSEPVRFHDNKEGVLGMRVARQLEQPAEKAEIFTDSSGRAMAVPKLDNTGVTGLYRSSEGKTGDAVWGTRARWVSLTGRIAAEQITLAIFDHPANPGYPTYWHARGYGLFAANPLGQKVFSNGKETLDYSLKPGETVTFRHRLVILSGTTGDLDLLWRQFEQERR